MVKAKMSESGKCLPLAPRRYPRERSPVTLEMTDLSAVFHNPRSMGTPLAFTDVCEVQYASSDRPQGRRKRITR